MGTGIMSLPALAMNDKIVSSGKVLSVAEVKNIWLKMVTHKKSGKLKSGFNFHTTFKNTSVVFFNVNINFA